MKEFLPSLLQLQNIYAKEQVGLYTLIQNILRSRYTVQSFVELALQRIMKICEVKRCFAESITVVYFPKTVSETCLAKFLAVARYVTLWKVCATQLHVKQQLNSTVQRRYLYCCE